MAADRLELEATAHDIYLRLIKEVRECRVAFENAGIAVPARVNRFLDDEDRANGSPTPPSVVITPPPSPQRPPQARRDWLWLPVAMATPTTLVRGVLRDGRLQSRAIIDRIGELRVDTPVSPGVIANIGTRLDEKGEITRDEDGWALTDPERAPIILEGHLWGPKSAFEQYDLAEHRRNCVVHVIRAHPVGLQIVQILKMLEACGWVQAPLSKDLIKTDLHTLDGEGRAKRIGNSGKWRAI
jgi:hypothetical protein